MLTSILRVVGVCAGVIEKVMTEGGSVLDEYKIHHSQLEFELPLGEGTFGMVHSGQLHGEAVAIKTVRTTKVTEETIARFRCEIVLMAP